MLMESFAKANEGLDSERLAPTAAVDATNWRRLSWFIGGDPLSDVHVSNRHILSDGCIAFQIPHVEIHLAVTKSLALQTRWANLPKGKIQAAN